MVIIQVSTGDLRIPVDMGGGIEAYVLHLSKSLASVGHTVTVLDRKYSASDPDLEDIDGVKIVRLRSIRAPRITFTTSFALNQLLFGRAVKKYLAKTQFDVVQLHQSLVGLSLAMTSPRLRRKLFYISQTSRRGKESPGPFDRLALSLENRLARRVRKVMVLNERARDTLISGARLNAGDVVLLPVSIDLTRFNGQADPDATRRRYGLADSAVVLFVGRIHVDKGVEYLVRAANIVVNEFGHRETRFVLVGPTEQFGQAPDRGSPYGDRIAALIDEYDLRANVTLTGVIPFDDLKGLYAACDMLVLPSLTEAAPTVPLEAMAFGKPVIGTRVGGIPAEVREGKTGFLVEARDAGQLAQRIKYLLDHPSEAAQMGRLGKQVVEQEFAWPAVARRLTSVYESGQAQ